MTNFSATQISENNHFNYDWILFDADKTLFDFNDKLGLEKLFTLHGLTLSEVDYQQYKKKNTNLWHDFEAGIINSNTIKTTRFKPWEKKFNMPSSHINDKFIEAMIEICEPLTGAIELINNLHNKVNLGMITNGFNSLQQARLDKNGMRDKFKIVVTSEQATYAKPSPKIFDYAFKKMNQSNKERVLMIGDNLDTDILGGQKYGIHTCWFNPQNKPMKSNIPPQFQVSRLCELESIITDSNKKKLV